MRRLRAIAIAALLPAGCATIPPRVETVPVPCVTDPAIVGRWSDARMTQLGPAWARFSFTADCQCRSRVRLLYARIDETSRYEARDGVITFFRQSGETRWPYRVVGDRLELQEAADERYTYSRK